MVLVGTSGFNYPHWQGVFYPETLPINRWFEYYTQFFNSIELNVTFYRNLKKQTYRSWFKRSPKDFYFVIKGNRFITHLKRLNTDESIDRFFDNCLELKNKLSAILWQLPEGFKKNLKRLEDFLKKLKEFKIRNIFEFRNKTWFDEDTYNLLKDYNACLCIADSPLWPKIKVITADFIYLRFHGKENLYSGSYSDKELKEWANFAKSTKKDIFAFFNNDAFGNAIKNALRFKELLLEK